MNVMHCRLCGLQGVVRPETYGRTATLAVFVTAAVDTAWHSAHAGEPKRRRRTA